MEEIDLDKCFFVDESCLRDTYDFPFSVLKKGKLFLFVGNLLKTSVNLCFIMLAMLLS